MADAPEERKSLRIRVLDDNFNELPSETASESSNATPKPSMNTKYKNDGSRTSDVQDGTVRQGWFPEDWLDANQLGTLTRLGTSSTKTLSGSFPSRIGGASGLFNSRSGSNNALTASFTRTGSTLQINGTGTLVWGVGVTASNKTRLNERACYDSAIGMLMAFDTSNTDYSGSNTMKFEDIYLLYMKKGDTSKTYYSPLVQDNKFANQDENRTRKSDETPIGKRINSSHKDDKWNDFPHIGGMFAAYIPQSDIDIIKGGDYRCTGIVWRVTLGGGTQTMSWYDHKFVFVEHQEVHKRVNSLKIIQVPQTFTQSFDIKNFELARAPEHSYTYT